MYMYIYTNTHKHPMIETIYLNYIFIYNISSKSFILF